MPAAEGDFLKVEDTGLLAGLTGMIAGWDAGNLKDQPGGYDIPGKGLTGTGGGRGLPIIGAMWGDEPVPASPRDP